MSDKLQEIKHKKCNRLLVKADIFIGEVKCGKCGDIIKVKHLSQKSLTELFQNPTIESK